MVLERDESDSDDDGALARGCEWNLGFVEPPEDGAAHLLLRHHFPSKVGGQPAWLNPVDLPGKERLACPLSGKPLDFLLQVYSPHPTSAAAFHRVVYLFVSPEGNKLAERGCVRALRCQLPRRNDFYPYEPPGTHEGDVDEPPVAATLTARAPAQPWVPRAGAAPPFPELALVVEPEPEKEGRSRRLRATSTDDAVELPTEAELAAQVAEITVSAGQEDAEEEDEQEEDDDGNDVYGGDPMGNRFRARVARAPDQCLRYCYDPRAEPLWLCTGGVPDVATVPPCGSCGAARCFEFQVMPQLLNHLGLDAENPQALDFGGIAVYSCPNSCETAEAYTEEAVLVQLVS